MQGTKHVLSLHVGVPDYVLVGATKKGILCSPEAFIENCVVFADFRYEILCRSLFRVTRRIFLHPECIFCVRFNEKVDLMPLGEFEFHFCLVRDLCIFFFKSIS